MKKVNTIKLAVPVERTIEKLSTAWSLKYANQVHSNFCANICKGMFAGSCESCPVFQAHELAVQQIRDGVRTRPEYMNESLHYGAYRHYDRKGNKTEVWRAPLKKEVK